MSLSNYEPDPQPGQQVVMDLVVKDLENRKEFGYQKYKTFLETFNGRDTLTDIYQELMDATIYMRQLIAENSALWFIWENRNYLIKHPDLISEINAAISRHMGE